MIIAAIPAADIAGNGNGRPSLTARFRHAALVLATLRFRVAECYRDQLMPVVELLAMDVLEVVRLHAQRLPARLVELEVAIIAKLSVVLSSEASSDLDADPAFCRWRVDVYHQLTAFRPDPARVD